MILSKWIEIFCRWFWPQLIWLLWWSMQLVENSLKESAMLVDSVKMRLNSSLIYFDLIDWLQLLSSNQVWFLSFFFLIFQARYFFQQLISGVNFCHNMVQSKLRVIYNYHKSHLLCLFTRNYYNFWMCLFLFLCSKSAIETWNWKIPC